MSSIITICGHSFVYAINEDFSELKAFGPISLKDTTAERIELMSISLRSKILLSRVVGAAFQYLNDNHIPYNLSGLLIITNNRECLSIESKIDILANSLHSLRELLQCSAADLGTKLGVTRQTINNIERNKTMTKTQYLAMRYLFDNIAHNQSVIYSEFTEAYKKLFKEE